MFSRNSVSSGAQHQSLLLASWTFRGREISLGNWESLLLGIHLGFWGNWYMGPPGQFKVVHDEGCLMSTGQVNLSTCLFSASSTVDTFCSVFAMIQESSCFIPTTGYTYTSLYSRPLVLNLPVLSLQASDQVTKILGAANI